ncbi:RecX family transcriptional regulator [Paenibacillus sp. ACRRX]|uniref:regulatory protein RecX n=1 Tax=unclassified Paenibacillus TaxID=185978 RepID=UPI001EF564AD|nr:RecX family transcriptional regulator [Paenibacillus sp. UMB4589-SE434]MCG7407418.1 RecX family transcriptional regulator [Paenibacillus sp. ACRRX]MDK8180653.1 RecX family transcriptional regulator [Paenibacillus sp. UMB4589-SE434]
MSEQGQTTVIIRVEQDEAQKGRYTIHFEHAAPLNVHEDVMIKYRLLRGAEVSLDFMEEIVRADEKTRAYVQALKYLQRKPRTSTEISRNLIQKGYDEEIIQIVVQQLEREWLVDDGAYAEQWTEQRVTRHLKGRRWVQHELKQKGVHERHIANAMASLDPEQELESAFHAARKKWRQTSGEAHLRRQKVAAYLARRGFPTDMARKAAYEASQHMEIADDETSDE